MAEKPRFRRRTVFAKNLGFGVSFGYRNNTIDVEVNFTRCGNLTPRFLQRCSTNRRCMIVSWLSAWTSGSTRYSRRYQRGCLLDSRVLALASELVDCLYSTLLRSPVSRPAYLLKGTLWHRLSHMFLCSIKCTYIWYNFTTKMILIQAAVI